MMWLSRLQCLAVVAGLRMTRKEVSVSVSVHPVCCYDFSTKVYFIFNRLKPRGNFNCYLVSDTAWVKSHYFKIIHINAVWLLNEEWRVHSCCCIKRFWSNNVAILGLNMAYFLLGLQAWAAWTMTARASVNRSYSNLCCDYSTTIFNGLASV